MTEWLKCGGYFSEIPREDSHWIGWENGKFTDILDQPPEDVAGGQLRINSDRKLYACPLLSDGHVHCYMEPWPLTPEKRQPPGSGTFEEEFASALGRVKRALQLGVGFLRDMGDPLGINLAVKREAANGGTDFPSLQVPGPAIHRPNKYGRYLGIRVETKDEICRLIDRLIQEEDVDFIKLVTTGIVDFSTRQVRQAPQFTPSELDAVVSHVHARGRKVASHCSGQAGLDINIGAGVDFIEHAYFVRSDQQDQIIEQGLAWQPTFAPVHQQGTQAECGWDDEVRESITAILEGHYAALEHGAQEGMRILVGTDAGCPGVEIGGGLFIEMECLARRLDRKEVLRMATAGNADAFGHSSYTGRIAAGQPASFALYEQPPWQDFRVLGRPIAVYHHGESIQVTPFTDTPVGGFAS